MADLKEIKKILLDIKRSLERNQQDIMSRLQVSCIVVVVVVVVVGLVKRAWGVEPLALRQAAQTLSPCKRIQMFPTYKIILQ